MSNKKIYNYYNLIIITCIIQKKKLTDFLFKNVKKIEIKNI